MQVRIGGATAHILDLKAAGSYPPPLFATFLGWPMNPGLSGPLPPLACSDRIIKDVYESECKQRQKAFAITNQTSRINCQIF